MVTFNVLDFNLASPGAVDGHAVRMTGPPGHTLDAYLTSVAVVTGQKRKWEGLPDSIMESFLSMKMEYLSRHKIGRHWTP